MIFQLKLKENPPLKKLLNNGQTKNMFLVQANVLVKLQKSLRKDGFVYVGVRKGYDTWVKNKK